MTEEELNSKRRTSKQSPVTYVALETGFPVYHGTCHKVQMIDTNTMFDLTRPYNVPDLKFLTKLKEHHPTPFLVDKEFFVTNKETAKAYGTSTVTGSSNSYQFVRMVDGQPYVIYDEMYPPCCELEFKLKKEVNLLDLSDTKTVETLNAFLTKNDKVKVAFMGAFALEMQEKNLVVMRQSSVDTDKLALELLKEYAKASGQTIDGYYFCCVGLHEEVCLFDPNATLVFTGGGEVGETPQSQMTREQFFTLANNFFPVYEPAKHGPCSTFPKSPIDVTKDTIVVQAGERIFKSQQQYIEDQARCFDFIHSFQRCVTHQHTVNHSSNLGTGDEIVLYAISPYDAYKLEQPLTLFSISTDTGDIFDHHITSPLDGDELYNQLIIEYEDNEGGRKRIPNLANISSDIVEGLCARKQVDGIFIRGNDIDLKYNRKPSDQTLSKDALYVSEKAMGKINKEEIKAPSKEDFEKKFETSKMKSKSEHTALIFSKYGLLEKMEFHKWKP